MAEVTHYAFTDESKHNVGRYRGLAMLSMPCWAYSALAELIRVRLAESNVSEFKWHKVKGAQYRFAAIKMLDLCFAAVEEGKLKIDVLIWDTQDRRHSIPGRDDTHNLANMYSLLFTHVLSKRWTEPENCTWRLLPDENTSLDWSHLKNRVEYIAHKRISEQKALLPQLQTTYNISEITEVHSHEEPLAMAADLFVGIGVFSHENSGILHQRAVDKSPQPTLFFDDKKNDLTSREEEHCVVVDHLLENVRRVRGWDVKLCVNEGLRTRKKGSPINFWLYQPQRAFDKAPRRK